MGAGGGEEARGGGSVAQETSILSACPGSYKHKPIGKDWTGACVGPRNMMWKRQETNPEMKGNAG